VPAAKILLDEHADVDLQAMLLDLVREDAADRDTLDFLIQKGVDINQTDRDGRPALHLAIATGNVKLAKRMIIAGADVNQVDASGATPLSLTQTLDDPATAKIMATLLTQYGAAQ
jgi:ankyrin repeat protein